MIFLVAALFGACGGGDDCGDARGVATFTARNGTFEGGLCEQTDALFCDDYATAEPVGLVSVISSLSGNAAPERIESGTACEPTVTVAEAGGAVAVAHATYSGDGWDVEVRIDRADGNVCCYTGRLE